MQDSHRTYFENRVLTASPAKLQWMLLDGALRATRLAEELLVDGQPLRANVELAQAEAILAEIVGAMRKEINPEIVAKSAAIYAFIIRRLTEAHLSGEVQPVRDAVRVLEVELETWRQLCEHSDEPAAPPAPVAPPPHIFSTPTSLSDDAYSGGFSFEA
jgi:flagellar protein FliS